MSTKKFIVSISCALAVLIVLSLFTLGFVSSKSHRAALLGTWSDVDTEDLTSVIITFNQDDTYEKTTTSLSEGSLFPETKVEKGTFTIFGGKIKLSPENGEKEVLTYNYNGELNELELDSFTKAN